jgi:hypothetical protein
MATAVLSKTLREPTTAEITQFIMTGDFTQGSGINVQVSLNILDDSDGSVNRKMSFALNASTGQKNHFQTDVVAAMSTVIADVEAQLGVTFA